MGTNGDRSHLFIIGTRPEAIKLAPVIAELRGRSGGKVLVCHTGQHRELLNDALAVFGIEADYYLGAMVAGQSLLRLQSRLFASLEDLFLEVRPDSVIVQGDTASVAVAAWAAFLSGIHVAHVEAGLRSGNRLHPFPEEINRRITTVVADTHFAPTAGAADNLLREAIDPARIFVTGNTVVDALQALRGEIEGHSLPLHLDVGRPLVLVTAHRRENHGAPLAGICNAIRRIAAARPDVQLVVPVHPNPDVHGAMSASLGGIANCLLTPPLSYRDFVSILLRAKIALTDSGGIQEEGPCLGLPVLVMREVTERPEGVAAGSVRLVGTDEDTIVETMLALLEFGPDYQRMAVPRLVYGDGCASGRIVDVLLTGQLQRPPFQPSAS